MNHVLSPSHYRDLISSRHEEMVVRRYLILLFVIQGINGIHAQTSSGDVVEDITSVILHANVTLPCHTHRHESQGAYWAWEGVHGKGQAVLPNGSLVLLDVVRENSGHYTCYSEKDDQPLHRVHLLVVGPPDPPQNVTIHATTVIAIVTWHLHLDQDWEESPVGPKTTLHLQYRRLPSEEWFQLPQHIAPSQGQLDVYHLHPNSEYEFQLWTTNQYGASEVVSVVATTLHNITETELARMSVENMKDLSSRMWIGAVIVIMVVINVLLGFVLAFYFRQHRYGKSPDKDDAERIELVPHIIENPGYQVTRRQQKFEDTENLSYEVDPSQKFEGVHESFLSPAAASHVSAAVV